MRTTKGFIFIFLFIIYLLAAAFLVDLYQSRDSATPLLVDNFEIQIPTVLPLFRGLPDDLAKDYLGELHVVQSAVSRILAPLETYVNSNWSIHQVCDLYGNSTERIESFPQLSPAGALQFLQCSSVRFVLDNSANLMYPCHGIYQEYYSNVTLHYHCVKFQEMQFLEQNASRPHVALASFPGSGMTWLRYLVEQATGVYTGSMECDISLKHVGHMGEGVWTNHVAAVRVNPARLNLTGSKNKTMFASGYGICQNDSAQFDKAVIVMRNPYTAILSEYNRMVTLSHVEKLPLDHYRTNFSLWNASMYWLMDEWYNFTVRILDSSSNVPQLVVAYSDLKQNSAYELERILKFIEVPYNQETLHCAVKPRVSPFRLESVDLYLVRANPYTRAQIMRLDQLIQSLAPILSKHDMPYYNWYRYKS